MKITLHLEGTRQEILAQIDEARVVINSSLEAQPPKDAKKTSKTTKATKEEPAEEEEEAPGEDDAGDEPADESEVDLGEDEPAEEDDGPSLDQVKKALKAFAAKGDKFKQKAMALLKSYKIKHVDDLPKGKYAEVLKKLK